MSGIQQLDEVILNFIQSHMHTALLDKTMPFVSLLGNVGFVWIAIAVIFLLSKKYRPTGFLILIALTLCFLLGDIFLKPFIARPRPFTIHPAMSLLISPPTDFSFPSGHTGSSFSAAIIILLNRKSWGIATMILASLIAFSRLYLYVHYPSDIIGGFLLSIVSAFLSIWLFSKIKIKRRNPESP